jgi:hypothetical protein
MRANINKNKKIMSNRKNLVVAELLASDSTSRQSTHASPAGLMHIAIFDCPGQGCAFAIYPSGSVK